MKKFKSSYEFFQYLNDEHLTERVRTNLNMSPKEMFNEIKEASHVNWFDGAYFLQAAFVWKNSPEGHDFWQRIFEKINNCEMLEGD